MIELLELAQAAAPWVGLAALVTVIINIFKKFNIIPDGWGGFAALIGDLLLMVIAAVAGYFEFDLSGIDAIAALVAQLLVLVLGSFGVHWLGRKMSWPLFRER